MPYLSTPEFDQSLIEVQTTMWEAGALMLALSTIVFFIIILGSIAWLCFSEMSGARRGRRITHEAQRENNPVALFAYRDANGVRSVRRSASTNTSSSRKIIRSRRSRAP